MSSLMSGCFHRFWLYKNAQHMFLFPWLSVECIECTEMSITEFLLFMLTATLGMLCASLNAFSSNLLMHYLWCKGPNLQHRNSWVEWERFIRRMPNIPCSSQELEIAILKKKTKRGLGLEAYPIFGICGFNLKGSYHWNYYILKIMGSDLLIIPILGQMNLAL